MKRTIESIKPNEVVNCKTEQDAIDFCKLLHESGKRWCSGRWYTEHTNWNEYKENTCYSITGWYSSRSFYISVGMTVLDSSEFINETKNINELLQELYDANRLTAEEYHNLLCSLDDSIRQATQCGILMLANAIQPKITELTQLAKIV